jgi:hypothetical protein
MTTIQRLRLRRASENVPPAQRLGLATGAGWQIRECATRMILWSRRRKMRNLGR